jgi:glycosyltransferase involved in cell wall biosynthesis
MRILLVGDYPRDSRLGSTKVFIKLQEEFRAAGHSCDLVLADDFPGLPQHRLARWAFAPAAAATAIRRAIRKCGRYDVIDVASAEGLWVATWRRIGGLPGTPVIARSNGIEHLNYRRMLADADAGLAPKPWTRRFYYPAIRLSQVAATARLADRLIVLNEADREFVLDHGWKNVGEVDLVAHGVSARFLESTPVESRRGRGVLFCGTWDHTKGITYLVDAFTRLAPQGVRLTVFGGGVPASDIRAAFPAAAQTQLTIVDRTSEDLVIDAYRTHDVLAFPSTYEGFGMVLMEAMSQGLPVVTTPVGCATALVVDGLSGIVVPPRDGRALAEALACLLGDPALRARLADQAHRRVRTMTWSRTAEATLDVYHRAVGATRALAHA